MIEPISLTLRSGQAGRLSEAQVDGNWQAIQAAVNALVAAVTGVAVVQDPATTHNVAANDQGAGTLTMMTSSSANQVYIQADSTLNLPVGSVFNFSQVGSGQTTIAFDGAVTFKSLNDYTNFAGDGGVVTLIKIASNFWFAFGALSS